MTKAEFEALKEMVKAAGQELIEQADDFVGNNENIVSFSIRIDFPIGARTLNGYPTIIVNREYISKKFAEVLANQKAIERTCVTCRHKGREDSKQRCFSCETSVGYRKWKEGE